MSIEHPPPKKSPEPERNKEGEKNQVFVIGKFPLQIYFPLFFAMHRGETKKTKLGKPPFRVSHMPVPSSLLLSHIHTLFSPVIDKTNPLDLGDLPQTTQC